MVMLETVKTLDQNVFNSILSGVLNNPVINSAFDVWQRGTPRITYSTDKYGRYSADRWEAYRSSWTAGYTVSRQDGTGVLGCTYCARLQRDSGNTSNADRYLAQTLDLKDVPHFRGSYVTLSFWARKGANYSASGDYLYPQVITGTVINQPCSNGFTGQAQPIDSNCVLTTSWQRFTFVSTVVIPATTNNIGVIFIAPSAGTAGANDYVEITGVQLNIGVQALPFSPRLFSEELLLCQRTFEKSYDYDVAIGTATYIGAYVLVEQGGYWFQNPQLNFRVSKALIPQVGYYSPYTGSYGYFAEHNSGDVYTGSKGINALNIGENGFFWINPNGNSAGAGNFGRVQWMAISDV